MSEKAKPNDSRFARLHPPKAASSPPSPNAAGRGEGDSDQFTDASLLALLMDSLPAFFSYLTRDLCYGWINRQYES